jgi:hypothetical protein
MATIKQLIESTTLQNPRGENADFLAQTPTTEITRQSQEDAGPLSQLAELMHVPIPKSTIPIDPFNSYAGAFTSSTPVVVDSVAKARRNPLRTDQDQPEYGLQIPL